MDEKVEPQGHDAPSVIPLEKWILNSSDTMGIIMIFFL